MYSSWHPHYTPQWLSEKLAERLPSRFRGAVIDPACGSGNLLAAAAVHLRATNRRNDDLEFVGTDISIRAVRACRSTLSRLLPDGNFRIDQADFLTTSVKPPALKPVTVVMNPPFRGYGELRDDTRRRISRLLDMKGRFNLGYAFVHHAVMLYQPETLVSLLPSNWVYSRGSSFRSELDALNGTWDWEDVGDTAFRGLSVHLGILVWHPRGRTVRPSTPTSKCTTLSTAGLEVRQGVATGSDAVFFNVAESELPIGTRMPGVRGREVDRGANSLIWVTPANSSDADASIFARNVSRIVLAALKKRTCVASRHRRIFEYHDKIPTWFSDGPKLLLPEIAVADVRVELDRHGAKLPLHSVIAIKVPSISVGLALRRYLKGSRQQRRLLSNAPRLSGGAARLQVGAIRDALMAWLRKKQRKRSE
jgi:predicted RNA methylase